MVPKPLCDQIVIPSVASICETVLRRIIIIHVLFSVRGIRFLDKKNNYYFIRNIVD